MNCFSCFLLLLAVLLVCQSGLFLQDPEVSPGICCIVVQALLTGQAPDTWFRVGGVLILVGVLALTSQENISDMFSSFHLSHNGLLYQTVSAQMEYQSMDEASRLYG